MLSGTVRWLAAGVVLAAGLCDASLAAPAAKLQNVGAGGTLRLRSRPPIPPTSSSCPPLAVIALSHSSCSYLGRRSASPSLPL